MRGLRIAFPQSHGRVCACRPPCVLLSGASARTLFAFCNILYYAFRFFYSILSRVTSASAIDSPLPTGQRSLVCRVKRREPQTPCSKPEVTFDIRRVVPCNGNGHDTRQTADTHRYTSLLGLCFKSDFKMSEDYRP